MKEFIINKNTTKMTKERKGNIAGNIILGIFYTLFTIFIIFIQK